MKYLHLRECDYSAFSSCDEKVLLHMIKLCTCSIYTGMLKMLCASLVVPIFYTHAARLKVFLDSSGLSQNLKISADWKPCLHERMPF